MEMKIFKVGIFWSVPNGLGGESVLEFSKDCLPEQANSLGFVNYPYSHLEMWDEVESVFLKDDCYYFPRGRVIFDINRDKHLIYADECVTKRVIDELIILYGIEDYELLRDEHYVCQRCQKMYNSLYCFGNLSYNISYKWRSYGIYKNSDSRKN